MYGTRKHAAGTAEARLCRSCIESLPPEVLFDVLARLDIVALARTAMTSQSMRRIALQDALWKPVVKQIIHRTSPPSTGSRLNGEYPSYPLWHPRHRNEGAVSYPAFPPMLEEFLVGDEDLDASQPKVRPLPQLKLEQFSGAESFHQVYTSFLQKFEPLLGWWASDVPSYGMVIRVILDMRFSSPHAVVETPTILCQRIFLVNRLQDLNSDTQEWRDATGFPMPAGTGVIDGMILRRALTGIRTDICEAGLRTQDLWKFDWKDALESAPTPVDKSSVQAEGNIIDVAWRRSLASHEAGDLLSTQDVEEASRMLLQEPFFTHGFEFDLLGARNVDQLRAMLAKSELDARTGQERLVYPTSGRVSTRPRNERIRGTDTVQVQLQPWQPYRDANERNAPFQDGVLANMPMPPVIFPPPALLPAVRAPPFSVLHKRQIGMSGIQEHLSTHSRFLLDSRDLLVDSMVMDPTPPYSPWPTRSHDSGSGLRFFPIHNPPRDSRLPKPRRIHRQSSGESETIEYEHTALAPSMDPGHADFDWSLVEGLYSMTYGPHGMELLYVRARALTLLDFGTDDSLPNWPAEPDMSTDEMYDHMRIDRRHATRIGARVLEGIKVTGDPNIPRGQVTWRAFIDDPDRSAVRWRPPPSGYRAHTPWPLRAPQALSQTDERSPGLVLPAHGRVAGEGFVGPGWAPALACISSIDELQIWWQPMYKVSIAKKLIGV